MELKLNLEQISYLKGLDSKKKQRKFLLDCLVEEITTIGKSVKISDLPITKEYLDSNDFRITTKPPLGIKPLWMCNYLRLQEINDAISRYEFVGKEIPKEWIEEKQELELYSYGRFKNDETANKNPEKEYEILSFENPRKNIFSLDADGNYYYQTWKEKNVSGFSFEYMANSKDLTIHSVKRLSDGEIFTLGNLVDFGNFGKKGAQHIEKFEIDYFDKTKISVYNGAYGIGLQKWKKVEKPLPQDKLLKFDAMDKNEVEIAFLCEIKDYLGEKLMPLEINEVQELEKIFLKYHQSTKKKYTEEDIRKVYFTAVVDYLKTDNGKTRV